MTIYNKVIKEIININDISSRSSVLCKKFITQKLKYLGKKEGFIINFQFNNRLKIELILANIETYLICRLLKLKEKY